MSQDGGEAGDANASAANAVAAGIAASDAIAGRRLGYCSKSQDHRQAEALLKDAGTAASVQSAFSRLLTAKSLAMYGSEHLSGHRVGDLISYARRLVDTMEETLKS